MDMSEWSSVAEVADHGGNVARARQEFPHAPQPWLDLSTGINPHPYPFGAIPASAFQRLPDESRMRLLLEHAATAYGAPSPDHVLAAPGTQILLPLLAGLARRGRAAILSPTYGEHRRAAALAGHEVTETGLPQDISAADYGVIVNPNNPDGRILSRATLLETANTMQARGGLLLIDEAFMDVCEPAQSLAADVESTGAVVLRSFGKFFGLAGIRLGFAVGPRQVIAALRARLGPWSVSGPAIEAGIAALSDGDWQRAMRMRLAEESAALDRTLAACGLAPVSGTTLFRFVRHAGAQSIYRRLGEAGILIRRFDWDGQALRFGLPADAAGRERLHAALMQQEWRER